MYPKYTVSARDHGLTEGEAFQTAAIQAAIDDVFTHGGGEVTIPAGRYLTGGLRLRSGVTLHLLENACLLGSQDPDDYDILERDTLEPIPHDDAHKRALSRWNHGLIMLVDAENVAIIGEKGSVIDGRDCYDPVGEEHYRGPHGIHAINSRNLTFRGYTIQNTGNWAHCILSCRAIEAENLTVLAGHDGFHVRACENIRVEHCVFHTGDDAIAGFADLNMVVRDCELNSACSDFRFGGTNVLCERIHAFGPGIYGHRYTMSKEEQAQMLPTNDTHRHNTLAFFTYFCTDELPLPAEPGNMIFRDCVVEGPDRFFQFNFSGSDPWQSGSGVKNVRFENMKVSGISMPTVVYAAESLPVVMEMRDLTYSLREGFENIDVIQVGNFERLSFHNVSFPNNASGHLIRAWGSEGILEQDNLEAGVGETEVLIRADQSFASARI